jgi:hypothetical protein
MAENFLIQASSPRGLPLRDAEDASLSDAIQTVFPLKTEGMYLIWNGISVPLSYKYDVSLMVDDVLHLLAQMLGHATGYESIDWPSNTFAATWEVRWGAGHVVVVSDWRHVAGGTRDLLGASGSIQLDLVHFMREWRRPLEVVAEALQKAGYEDHQILGLSVLRDTLRNIVGQGELYQDV